MAARFSTVLGPVSPARWRATVQSDFTRASYIYYYAARFTSYKIVIFYIQILREIPHPCGSNARQKDSGKRNIQTAERSAHLRLPIAKRCARRGPHNDMTWQPVSIRPNTPFAQWPVTLPFQVLLPISSDNTSVPTVWHAIHPPTSL